MITTSAYEFIVSTGVLVAAVSCIVTAIVSVIKFFKKPHTELITEVETNRSDIKEILKHMADVQLYQTATDAGMRVICRALLTSLEVLNGAPPNGEVKARIGELKEYLLGK